MLCESFIVDMEERYSAMRPNGPIKPQGKRVSGLEEKGGPHLFLFSETY